MYMLTRDRNVASRLVFSEVLFLLIYHQFGTANYYTLEDSLPVQPTKLNWPTFETSGMALIPPQSLFLQNSRHGCAIGRCILSNSFHFMLQHRRLTCPVFWRPLSFHRLQLIHFPSYRLLECGTSLKSGCRIRNLRPS